MSEYDYDLFVIGGGSGGVRAARIAAAEGGAKVGLAEESRMGNYGIYFGNQNAGQIALVAGGTTK